LNTAHLPTLLLNTAHLPTLLLNTAPPWCEALETAFPVARIVPTHHRLSPSLVINSQFIIILKICHISYECLSIVIYRVVLPACWRAHFWDCVIFGIIQFIVNIANKKRRRKKIYYNIVVILFSHNKMKTKYIWLSLCSSISIAVNQYIHYVQIVVLRSLSIHHYWYGNKNKYCHTTKIF